MSISRKQLNILNKSKLFINQAENNFLSGLLYLNSWDSFSIGNAFLRHRIMNSTSKFRFYTKFFKNILGIRYLNKLQLLKEKVSLSKYDSIIFSWCKSSDFDINGNYRDRYFNTSSEENKNFYWFLISTDQIIPKTTGTNIQILYSPSTNFFSNIYFIFKTIFKNIKFKKKVFLISYEELFAKVVSGFINKYDTKSITRVLQPYEAQPFQHAINSLFKKRNIKTIGYLHSLLPPVPTDLIYRSGAPDILYVHGFGQIKILEKFLNWKSNVLRFTPSYRFRVNQSNLSGVIFLPYDFKNEKFIVDSFELFLTKSKPKSLPFLIIKSHPLKLKSTKHNNLIKKIDHLINKYQNRFNSKINSNISIVIGVSAVIMEALERNVKTIVHIVDNPVLDSHQNILWDKIKVEILSKNIYTYELLIKNHYIHCGDNNLSLEKLI